MGIWIRLIKLTVLNKSIFLEECGMHLNVEFAVELYFFPIIHLPKSPLGKVFIFNAVLYNLLKATFYSSKALSEQPLSYQNDCDILTIYECDN